MHARGGLFREAADAGEQLGELVVDHGGQVAAVVEDHVERLAVGEEQRLLDAPIELLVGHALPGVDRDALRGDRGSGFVLRADIWCAAAARGAPGDRVIRALLARPRRARTLLAAAGVLAASLVVGTAATVGFGLATGFIGAARQADLPHVIARLDRQDTASLDRRIRALPNVAARSYRLELRNVAVRGQRAGDAQGDPRHRAGRPARLRDHRGRATRAGRVSW